MLKIEVASVAGQPPGQPLAAEFDEMGGSIGRADGNTLVLPDEKRYISRTQASLSFRAGGYVLRDMGSATPTIVNGSPVGNGKEVPLKDGDEIRIGEYALRVGAVTSMRAEAAAQPAAPPPVPPAHSIIPAAPQPAAYDPQDPFADLMPRTPSAPPATPAPAPRPMQPIDDPLASLGATPPGAPGVIPADFDPFGDLAPAPQAPAAPAAHATLPDDLGLAPTSGQSVDDIFGLKQSSAWDPLGPQDPLAPAGLAGPSGVDPLAPFSSPPRAPAAPAQRDDTPMLSSAFVPPSAKTEVHVPPPAPTPEPPAAPRAATGDMVVSWDTPQSPAATNEIKTMILASPKRAVAEASAPPAAPAAAPAPVAPEQPATPPPPLAPAPAAAAPPPPIAPRPAASAQHDASTDALLRAFLDGAGMPGMRLEGLTPEFMSLIGELLRESMRGTLELLLARALTKREVRAEATVIVARENNPLKFSPTVEAALANLLVPQAGGFMKPADAVRDAYNDLRSHQFGIMAGMRAALEGVIARFDPAQLESRLTGKSVLGSLVPSTRRAKLWELYEQLYRDISREAQDDFQTLFGKAFLRAYEAQIDKLEQEDTSAKR